MNEISEKAAEVAAKMAAGAGWLVDGSRLDRSWDMAPESVREHFRRVARAALTAALPHVVGWQPIETAPRDGTSILIWGKWGHVMQASWKNDDYNDAGYWRCGRQGAKGYDDTGGMRPTHWMPLPPAPTNPERGDG